MRGRKIAFRSKTQVFQDFKEIERGFDEVELQDRFVQISRDASSVKLLVLLGSPKKTKKPPKRTADSAEIHLRHLSTHRK